MGILNGFSEMGKGVAQFAGAAGMELQRSELAKQAAILADQLATTRETALQKSQQTYQSGENDLTRKSHSADIATQEAGQTSRNAETNRTSRDTNAATNAALMERVKAEINKPTELERIDTYLGINPDGTPRARGAAPAANSSGGSTAATPVPNGQGLVINSATGNMGTPGAGGLAAPAAGPAGALDPAVQARRDKALGLPVSGSSEATRMAIAQGVLRDHPDWSTDKRAAEVEKRVAEATEGGKATYTFSAPVVIDDPDNPGKKLSGVNRQNNRSGAVEFVRTDTDPNKGGADGQGNRAEVQTGRVIAAGNAATKAVENIMELPASTSTGWFPNASQGTGILAATKKVLLNNVTSQDVQSYKVLVAGVARNMATLETQGLAPPQGFTHSMEAVTLTEGNTQETKLRQLAEMRQIIEENLKPSLSNDRIQASQKELIRTIIQRVQTAVPFTQHDITVLAQAKNPSTSLADLMKEKGLGGASAAPEAAVAIPPWAKPGDSYSPSLGKARAADGTLYGPPQ